MPPPPPRATTSVHVALLVVQVCFASFSAAGKIALRQLLPLELAALRVTAAALIFLVVWLLVGRERVSRRDLGRLAVYSLFGIVLNQMLFLAGLSRTSATSAVVLGASIPAFTVAVALLLGREVATLLKLGGLAVALCGALVITGGGGLGGGAGVLLGNLLIVGNSLSYAIYLVISRDVLSRMRPLTAMVFVFLFGALAIDAALLVGGPLGVTGIDPLAFFRQLPSLPAETWRALAYIVAVPMVAAYLLNAVALRVVSASLAAVYIYVQQFMGALIAWWLLAERPGPEIAVGGVLIFLGIGLVNGDAVLRQRRMAVG